MNEQNNQDELQQPLPEYQNSVPPEVPISSVAPVVDLESELNSLDPTNQPDPAPQSGTPAPFPAPQKSHKGLKATVIVLVILLLAALGTIAYLLFFQPKNTEKTTDTTANSTQEESTVTEAEPKAEALVQKVREAVLEGLKADYPSATIESRDTTPVYKAPSVNYAVSAPGEGHTIAVSPTPTAYDEAGIAKVVQIITDTVEADTTLTKTSNDWMNTYQNESLICQLDRDGSPISFSCADTSVYSDEIAEVAPFAKAYYASEEGKKNDGSLGIALNSITEKSDGYKKGLTNMMSTNSPVGGYMGLFYYVNGQWTYWRGSQAAIDCTEYNTHDLQKAFEGDACFDNAAPNQMSTVKVTL